MLAALNAIPLFFYASISKANGRCSGFYISRCTFTNSMNAMRRRWQPSCCWPSPFGERQNKYYLLLMLLAMATCPRIICLPVWVFYKANLNFDNKLKYALAIAISFIITAWFLRSGDSQTHSQFIRFEQLWLLLPRGTVDESRNRFSNLGLNLVLYSCCTSIWMRQYIFQIIYPRESCQPRRTGCIFVSCHTAWCRSWLSEPSISGQNIQNICIPWYSLRGLSVYIYYLFKNLSEIVPYSNIFSN